MQCAHCGFANTEGMTFCEECGEKLVHVCPSCGKDLRPTAKFCGHCGTALVSKGKGKGRKGETAKRAKGETAKRKTTSEAGLRTLDSRPVSYTPRHLAERILAE